MTAALFSDLVVNGETVPHAVIAAEAQNHPAPRNKPGFAWRKAANAIAIRTLLLQEARRRGIDPEPRSAGSGRTETVDEALIRGLVESAIEIVPPTEDEIRAEWERDPSRFKTPPLWEASHVLCACDSGDGERQESARARALSLTRQAADNPSGFSALATRESDCGSKKAGGSLGQIGPGDTLPAFEVALRGLREGEVTAEPVRTRHGYHVIRLDAISEGRELPFKTARPKIAEAMEKAAWARAAKRFIDDLVSSAEISGADLQPI